jgi:hypothetical protein
MMVSKRSALPFARLTEPRSLEITMAWELVQFLATSHFDRAVIIVKALQVYRIG